MSVKEIMSLWCYAATKPLLGGTPNMLLLHC